MAVLLQIAPREGEVGSLLPREIVFSSLEAAWAMACWRAVGMVRQ